MPYKNKDEQNFSYQKHTAKRRGISFEFTFEDWATWWEENAGPNWSSLRGCLAGQLVMARYGDKGPYARGNVKCIRMSENLSETRWSTPPSGDHFNTGAANGSAKLTASAVVEARKLYARGTSVHTIRSLAQKFGISPGAMGQAIRGNSWANV